MAPPRMKTAGEPMRSRSPQDPADIVGEWPDGGAAAAERAIARARATQPWWAALSAHERSGALGAAAERVAADAGTLAGLMVREVGKPADEAATEVQRTIAILRYYAQAAFDADGETFPAVDGRSWLFARHRPRGVVGLITPWNFPVAIPVWKAAPALAWGNAVVLKPARHAMACAIRLVELLGLPDGVVEIVRGGHAAGSRLVARGDIDAVSFTGSTDTGRNLAVAAARGGIAFQGEMGGSNASILFDDADLERAAAMIASAAMTFAGQKCTATSRVVVVGDVGRACEALVAAVEAMTVGDPAAPDVSVGPMISEVARDVVTGAISRAVSAGAQVIAGGHPLKGLGWFVAPTLIRDVEPDAELAQEEVFGPICAVLAARDENEAAQIVDSTRFGLIASVFTGDLDRAISFADRLRVGMVRVNAPTTGVDFHVPFGGTRASSVGPREQGRAAREFYTTTTTVTVSPSR